MSVSKYRETPQFPFCLKSVWNPHSSTPDNSLGGLLLPERPSLAFNSRIQWTLTGPPCPWFCQRRAGSRHNFSGFSANNSPRYSPPTLQTFCLYYFGRFVSCSGLLPPLTTWSSLFSPTEIGCHSPQEFRFNNPFWFFEARFLVEAQWKLIRSYLWILCIWQSAILNLR